MHGVHVHGFPSLFIEGLSQGARLVSNITHNLNDAGKSIAAIIAKAIETDATEVEVTEEGERAWMELVDSGPEALLSSPDCTPGYYNNEGQPPTPADRRNAGGAPTSVRLVADGAVAAGLLGAVQAAVGGLGLDALADLRIGHSSWILVARPSMSVVSIPTGSPATGRIQAARAAWVPLSAWPAGLGRTGAFGTSGPCS